MSSRYPGFERVVYNAPKHEAHVHYETWKEAGVAREALSGFQLAPGVLLSVQFASA